MAKSRRYIKRSSKTKRGKRGGQKNEKYNPILSAQMQGGQFAPAPRPAPAPAGLNIYTIDAVSLRSSLQSFGDAVWAFKATAQTGVDTFQTPMGIPPAPGSGVTIYSLLLSQKSSADILLQKANDVMNSFYNTSATAVSGVPPGGIFRAIYGPTSVFVATPMPGAPTPAPMGGGGYMLSGGVAPAPRPAPASSLPLLNQANLFASLQKFGDSLISFRTAAEAQVAQVASPDLSTFQPNATTGPAYAAFMSQKEAADALVIASTSVLAAFAGSPSPTVPDVTGATVYDGVNGVRGLYRAIMGNNVNFVASP
jgi:hypothetical protein